MKLLSVVGARPQFVKLAPLDRAGKATGAAAKGSTLLNYLGMRVV